MESPTRVTSVDHLKELIASGKSNYAMVLERAVKSRKTITYKEETDMFSVVHHIDGTRQRLSGDAFLRSRMWDAIQRGAFFAE